MRLDCCWSMSIAGLTAQEIYLPPPSLFLRSSQCCSMSKAKPSWNDHDFNNFYVTLNSCNVHSGQVPTSDKQKLQSSIPQGVQPLLPKRSKPAQLSVSSKIDCRTYTPSPVKEDLVVSGFNRLSVSDRISPPQTPTTKDKPLPPIPVDNEGEFFSGDDSSCLVSKSKSCSSPFRYGMHSRRSFRNCGQINFAYFEGPIPQQRKHQQQSKKKQEHESQESLLKEQREQELQEEQEQEQEQQKQKELCQRQKDRAQRKLHRSHSGPAGSYNKPSALRLSCHQRNIQDLDKPEVPPRIPIPPRPARTGDYRRWSAEVSAGNCSDEDRPPRIPPREPLASSMPRASSPLCLPIYFNGVMPPTQSFAPDPNYVSRGLQRQNSEGSPCILPIMEYGRRASTTHYFLLPQRPSYVDKHEKYFVDNKASQRTEASASSLDWTSESKGKTHSDFV